MAPTDSSVGTGPPASVRNGLLAVFASALCWGLMPLYLRLLSPVPVFELLAWRILFTVPVAGLSIWIMREQAGLRAVLKPKLLATLALSAMLVGTNWGVYVWAVVHGHVLQASLGYFLNPLINVMLGVLVLRERLNAFQALAVALAGAGVALQAFGVGALPWVTLTLAFSWGFYTLVRRQAPAPPAIGLFVETLLLAPLALLALHHFASLAPLAFETADAGLRFLIACSGVITATPLVLFAFGAKRLTLATLGFMQYLAPTMQFCVGLILGEPFTLLHAASFALIWAGLGVYSWQALRASAWKPAPRASHG